MNMHHMHPWKGIRPWQRHSLVLLVAGFVYILIGVSFITAEATKARRIALKVALDWLSINEWGVIFILAGVLALISSRWPPISETWGYTVLTGLSVGWGAFYLVGVIFEGSPAQNLSGALSWGLLGFMWWAISGLVNPYTVHVLPARSDQVIDDSSEAYPPREE